MPSNIRNIESFSNKTSHLLFGKAYHYLDKEQKKKVRNSAHNKYYIENRESIIAKSNNYAKENRDKINKYYSDRLKIDAHYVRQRYHSIKCSSQKRGIELNISIKEFSDWHKGVAKICEYCGINNESLKKVYKPFFAKFSIDRKDNDKGYSLDNICYCCMKCNAIKSDTIPYIDMKEIGNKYLKKLWVDKVNTGEI